MVGIRYNDLKKAAVSFSSNRFTDDTLGTPVSSVSGGTETVDVALGLEVQGVVCAVMPKHSSQSSEAISLGLQVSDVSVLTCKSTFNSSVNLKTS